jgi:type IV secretory pathway VirB10-like protein
MARRKLKVFQAQFGFYDTVAAASSQPAALRAWGIHQNLFASGDVKVATDEAAVEAALEHPNNPLRRAIGSTDPFRLEPANLPKVPDASKRTAPRQTAKSRPAPPPPPAADRTALDAAEAALRQLDEARKREEADLRRRQDELDDAKLASQKAYVEAHKAAAAAVVEARKVYRSARGED